jgi:hypothetical protein
MIVSDVLTTVTSDAKYVAGSMILKSSNSTGCTYKYLWKFSDLTAVRREVFISTSTTEDDVSTRTATASIEVKPAE